MEITLTIKNSADKCLFSYECLKGIEHELCNVKDCINNKIIFIDKTARYCSYCMNFGNEFVCNCPVRKEIYFRYKV